MFNRLFLLLNILNLGISALAYGTTFVPVTIKQQIQESDALVQGLVSSIHFIELDGQITTKVSLDLNRWLGLVAEHDTVDVYYPGGEIGEEKLIVQGAPHLVLGENVVLFLKNKNELMWVNNLGLGKYSIKRVGSRNIILNQVFPGRPEVGQMDFQKFLDLSQWVKKQEFTVRFKDKYELNHEKTVQHYIQNQGRGIASTSPVEDSESGDDFSIYWLVLLFGSMGLIYRTIRNRST
jgi:hypothetical protein